MRCRNFVFKEGNVGDTSSTSAALETSLPMQFPSNCQIAFQNRCINAIKNLIKNILEPEKSLSEKSNKIAGMYLGWKLSKHLFSLLLLASSSGFPALIHIGSALPLDFAFSNLEQGEKSDKI